MKKVIMAFALLLSASAAHAVGSYLGTANQDVTVTNSQILINSTNTLNTSIVTPLPAGTNQIGTVGISSGSNSMSVNADGSINVTATVQPSTQTLRGRSGNTITSTTQGSGESLDVLDHSRANLFSKSLVYKSSDAMVVGGALTLTGLANQVDLQAIGNDCTFNLAGGESINVAKNTAESYNFDYTATNLTVNLTAKSGSATCKARITGAN